MPGNVVLIGFSGTGKSTVARLLAQRLGWQLVDTDQAMVEYFGTSIADVFRDHGEAVFRAAEREQVAASCARTHAVVSVGGGAVVDPASRARIRDGNFVVRLEATPETIYRRLRAGPGAEARPMLAGADPVERIRALKASRADAYDVANLAVDTENREATAVAEEIVVAVRAWLAGGNMQAEGAGQEVARFVAGAGILENLGSAMRRVGLKGRIFVVSDDRIFPLHGARAIEAIRRADYVAEATVLPHGERTKALSETHLLYDWLVDQRAERIDTIVALGGGVIGDLVGFVAATFLRGMSFVQVPTTLLAQVDSSIGGKVGVDHPRGKNLIGAFKPADLVLVDTDLLRTLPPREIANGWAEAIKCGLILDAELLDQLERSAATLRDLSSPLVDGIVDRCARHKLRVVAEDEREAGLRMILNYGHTIGQALEAALGYETLLHGEAISIGMTGAAMLSVRHGSLTPAEAARQEKLLQCFGLPTRFPSDRIAPPTADAIFDAMALDKKSRGAKIRWILLKRLGEATIDPTVPMELVREVVAELLA